MNMQDFAIKLTTSLILLLACSGLAQATGIDDGFDPNADKPVRAIVLQRDGGLLVGGKFTNIGGESRNLVARLRADGSANTDFDPDVAGGGASVVFALHEEPGGRVLIGGRFSTVGGQTRTNLARVNASGALDTTFNPGVNGNVRAFASQLSPDGLTGFIYVGGEFTQVNSSSRNGIVRLFANGSVDTSFVPPVFNGGIYAIRLGADGRVLVAGSFSKIDGNDIDAPLAYLNSDGSLDPTFSTQVSNGVQLGFIGNVDVQPDGKILIAGQFDIVRGMQRNQIARLHPNGQIDEDFVPPEFNNGISAMLLQADGRIMVAGGFTNSFFQQGVARLYPNGSYDTSFNALALGAVYTLVRQADGKYVIGGAISQYSIHVRNHIARISESGEPDVDLIADLSGGADSAGLTVAVQADNKILLGGYVIASASSRLTRLYGNGTRDTSFSAFVDGLVHVIIAQPDQKIVIAGGLNNIAGNIARLNSDGSIDSTFSANANSDVFAGALQRDGRIVVGGIFTKINGVPRIRIARLLLNGFPDPTFNSSVNGSVTAVVIQPDGKILIGGNFTKVNGVSREHIARLHANGSLDTGFVADVDDIVRSIVVDAEERILIGGEFDAVGGTSRVAIARLLADGSADTSFATNSFHNSTVVRSLALMSNGRIIIAGEHSVNSTTKAFVRSLSKQGTWDQTFDPGFVTPSGVTSLVIQPDGKLLFAGYFTSVGGEPRASVARYAQTKPAKEKIALNNGSNLSWTREGYGPELTAAPVVLWSTTCCNREDFVPLPNGVMQRETFAPMVWSLDNIPTAGVGTIWLRAVSIAGDGGHSVFPIESPIIALELDGISDRIFADGFE